MAGIITFVIWWAILALAVWVAAALVDGIELEGAVSIIAVSLILGLLNAYVKPALQILTLPITILTLGIFLIVLNALLLLLTEWIAEKIDDLNFAIDGFWPAVLGALIISLVTFVVTRFVDEERIAGDLTKRM
ncbi:MAG: phage holin family protein [SAR202 cluster bacterium]|nr:phage holin family protein [SAR202 cluster bacterium]